jgi:hypothetical protein
MKIGRREAESPFPELRGSSLQERPP